MKVIKHVLKMVETEELVLVLPFSKDWSVGIKEPQTRSQDAMFFSLKEAEQIYKDLGLAIKKLRSKK